MKSHLLFYSLTVLLCEKILQHGFVTAAFYFNLGDVRSTVSVPYVWLMVTGACIGILFVVALMALLRKKEWALPLIVVLAVVDIVGEFLAQEKVSITVTVSFMVAWILIVLVCFQLRENKILRTSFLKL